MTSRKLAAVLAGITLAAGLLAGCDAPGSSKEAVSFHGVTYTEGQVQQTANQLNEIMPAQTLQQLFGAPRLTRVQALNVLLYTPAVEAVHGDDVGFTEQVDATLEALKKQSGSNVKPSATTQQLVRNLIAVTSDATGDVKKEFTTLMSKETPHLSERYGKFDAEKGNVLLPNVPDVVTFHTLGQPHQ